MKTKLKYLLLVFLTLLLPISSTFAIDEAILDKLDNSNIYYYDPTGKDCSGSTSPLASISTDGANLTLIGDAVLDSAKATLKTTFPQLTDDQIITTSTIPQNTNPTQDANSTPTLTSPDTSSPSDINNLINSVSSLETKEIIAISLTPANPTPLSSTADFNRLINSINERQYLFLVTAHADPLVRSDLDFTTYNRSLRQIALAHKQVYLIDWAAAIDGKESTYLADGLIPNSAGQELFAKTVNQTINSLITSSTSAESFSDTTITNTLPTSTLTYLENAGVKERTEANLNIYQTVANEKNLPWQVLAAIHFREANLDPNKSLLNGQSIKSTPYTNVDGQTIATNLLDDARNAADHLIAMGKTVYGVELTANSSTADLSKAILAFGRGYMYKNASPEATYDQSPYIMNGYDEQHLNMRWIHADSYNGSQQLNGLVGKEETRPGALAVMSYLGATLHGVSALPTCGVEYGGILEEGGMTLEQARIFMMRYGENKNNDSLKAVGSAQWNIGCKGGGGSNCVTFSSFFVNKFSSSPWGGGNGNQVVGNLASHGVPTGDQPAVYSVLSTNDSSIYGHTAVVLGHHGNEWYIGHAGCSYAGSGKGNGTYEGGGAGFVFVETSNDPTEWNWLGSWVKFAYLEGVDTNKLQDYINNGS